jgi:hypothetical protein
MKFDDVDLFFDSFAKPGAINPMSSPTRKAGQEIDLRGANDRSKSTMAESSERLQDPFIDQPALKPRLIPQKRKTTMTEPPKTSQFKESSVAQKKNACNWDIEGSFKSQELKRQRLDSAFRNATLEKKIIEEPEIMIPSDPPLKELRQFKTLSFNE